MNLKKLLPFFLLAFSLLFVSQIQIVNAQTKPKMRIIISRAGEASSAGQVQNDWFSALSEAYYYFRFDPLETVKIIPRKKYSKALSPTDIFGVSVSEVDIFQAARELDATHVLIHTYDMDPTENVINYYLEVLTINKKVVVTFDESFPLQDVEKNLEACSKQIIKKLKITPSSKIAPLLTKPILVTDHNVLMEFGKALVEAGDKANEKDAKKLLRISDNNIGLALATYKAAYAFKDIGDCDNAAKLFNRVILRNRLPYSNIYLQASINYRKCQSFDDAERVLSHAETNGISSHGLLVEKALILEKFKRVTEARKIYDRILKTDPDQPDALLFLARQERQAGSYEKSLDYLDRYIKLSDNPGPAYLEMGLCYVAMKRDDEALSVLRKANNLLPDEPESNVLLGDIYFKKKEYGTAATKYGKALEKRSNNLDLLIKTSNAYAKAKNSKKALAILDKYKANFYDTKVVTKEIGLLKFQLKDTTGARGILETCLGIRPPDSRVFLAMGDIYAAKGERDKAIRMYEQADPLLKDKTRVKIALANLQIQNKDYDKAQKNLKAILSKDPDYPNANGYLADVLMAKGQKQQALKHYLKERELQGENVHFQQNIAEIYFDINNLSMAEKESRKLLTLDPINAIGYKQLTLIAIKNKNSTEAQNYISQAEVSAKGKLDPSFYKEVAKGFTEMKSWDNAIKSYGSYLKSSPKDEKAWIELSKVYLQARRDSSAARAYIKIYELSPQKNKDYLAKAGHTYYKLGMKKQAKETYSKFLTKGFVDPLVNVNSAHMEFAHKRYEKTISLLEGASGKYASDEEVVKMLAYSYHKTKKHSQALQYIKKHLANFPNDRKGVEIAALEYEKAGNIKSAADMYKKYLSRDKNQDYAYKLGALYEKLKQNSLAMGQYKKNIADYPEDFRSYERLAELYLASNQFDNAVKMLVKVTANPSADPAFFKKLAEVYTKQKKPALAAATYEQYLIKSPKDSDMLLKLGVTYYEKKDYEKALTPLMRAFELKPNNSECLAMIGHAYYKMGKKEDAYKTYSEFKRRGFSDPEVSVNLAKMEYKAKNYSKTISLLKNLTGKYASDPKVNRMLALSHSKMGTHSLAATYIKKLVDKSPNDPEALELAAISYEKTGDSKNAAAMFKRYIALPKSATKAEKRQDYAYRLATLYEKQKQVQQAVTQYNANIKEYPKDFRNYEKLGLLYLDSKQYTNAIKMLGKATQNPSADPDIFRKLAELYVSQKKLSEATSTYEKYLAKRGTDSKAWFALGKIYYNKKAYDKAVKPLVRASDLMPQNRECLAMAGHSYYHLGKMTEAYQTYNNFLKKGFKDLEVNVNIAAIEFKNKKYTRTISLLKNLTGKYASDPKVIRMLAISHSKMGTHSLALSYVKTLVEKNPSDPEALELAALTYEKTGNNKSAADMFKKYCALPKNKVKSKKRKEYAYRLAILYEVLKQPSLAIAQYKKNITYSPKDFRNHEKLGELYLKAKQYENAAQMMEKATLNPSADPNIYKKLAELYVKQKKGPKAASTYEKYLAKKSTDSKAWYELGNIYYKQKAYNKALKPLSRATELMPQNSKCLALTGHTYFALGKKAEAYNIYSIFFKKGFKDIEVNVKLAKMEFDNKKYTRTISLLKNLTGKHATDPKTIRMLAISHSEMGTHSLALSYIKKLVQNKPNDPEAIELAAITYEKTGDDNSAASMYKKYCSLPKEKVNKKKRKKYAFQLAELYEKQKQTSLAIAQYKKNTVDYPKDYRNYDRLGGLYLKSKQNANALLMFEKAATNPSASPDLHKKLAGLYEKQNKKSQAASTYEKYLLKRTTDSKAWYALGNIYYKQKAYEKAIKLLARASKLMPQNKECLALTGHTYYALGKKAEAYRIYDDLNKKGYKDPQVTINLATMEFDKKNHTRATALLKSLSGSKYTSDEKTIRMLAVSYYNNKKYSEALPYVKKLVAKASSDKEVVEIAAVTYEKTGDIRSASNMYKKFLTFKTTKKHQEYAYRLGKLYEKQKAMSSAITQYKSNILKYPNDLRNHERLAQLYINSKNYSQATRILTKVSSKASAPPTMSKQLAQIYSKQGKKSLAAAAYEKYLKKVPTDSTSFYKLGTIYYSQKAYKKAVLPLEAASVLMPRNSSCLYKLGDSYVKSGTPRKAINPLKKAYNLKKNDMKTISLLTKCYETVKDTNNLIAILQKYTALESKNFNRHSQLGNLLLKTNKTDQAISILEAASKIKPSHVQTHLALITLYKKKKNRALLIRHFNSALQFDPRNADLQFEKAMFHLDANELPNAKTSFKKTIQLSPKHARAHYHYGKILHDGKQLKTAFYHFGQAAKYSPKNTDYLLKLAQTAVETGNPKTAKTTISKAIKLKPNDPALVQMAGYIYYKTKDYQSAEKYLNQGMKLDRNCPYCHELLGSIYFANANYSSAITFLEKASNKDPNNDSVLVMLGDALAFTNQLRRALIFYNKAFGINPKNNKTFYKVVAGKIDIGMPKEAEAIMNNNKGRKKTAWVHLAQGRVLEANKNPTVAEFSYNAALRSMPNNSDAHMGLGRVYLEQKKYNKAVQHLSMAMIERPDDLNVFVGMGRAYYGLKNYSAALELFSDALKKNPKQHEANMYMGLIYSKRKKHDKAISLFEKSLAREPRNPDLYFMLAVEYGRILRFKESIASFLKVIKYDDSKAVVVYKNVGDLYYYKMKDKKKAKKYWVKYLKAGGTSNKVKSLLKSL